MASGVDFGVYINPDDVAATLAGDYETRVRAAQIIADERRAQAIADRRSFSFETVMSHPSKLDVLRDAKSAGFHVEMFFIATDNPETNVKRVATRVAKGGHDVPADRIVARYRRTLSLLPEAIGICDRVTLFDNSGSSIMPWFRLDRDETGAVTTHRQISGERKTPPWMPLTEIEAPMTGALMISERTTTTRWSQKVD
jgi:predicted ABC-type ATPase